MAAKQDSWFDFNGGGVGSTAKSSGLDGDAWSSAFSSPAAKTTAGTTADVWGASDPFANQTTGEGSVSFVLFVCLFVLLWLDFKHTLTHW